MASSSSVGERADAIEREIKDNDEDDIVKRKRNDQGWHECEVFGDGSESYEGARAWRLCKKNPGHHSFIPYPEFSLEDLPDGFQTQEWYDKVRVVADLTVRLRVGYTSTERPEGYPFYDHRGEYITHTGTGICTIRCTTKDEVSLLRHPDHKCRCPQCFFQTQTMGDSSLKHQEWYEIQVITAQHVVYNSEEAASTEVDFFFDDANSEFTGQMKTVYCYDFSCAVPGKDHCALRCMTHDKDFIERFSKVRFPLTRTQKLNEISEASVVVSHPHGRPKQITVGTITLDPKSVFGESMSYTMDTCPGSSGAPVVVLSLYDMPHLRGVHSLGGVKGSHNQGNWCSLVC